MWAAGKIGIVKCVWVCEYAPVNGKSRMGKKDMRKFWNYVNECERGSEIVLIRDMNGRVGNKEIAGVVRKWGMDEVNEKDEYGKGAFLSKYLFSA